MVAVSGGLFGVKRPITLASKMILPPHCHPVGNAVTLTAARYYIVPFYIDKPETFAGVKFGTSGTADNGFKVKIAFYSESASGGPGALAKSFGEVTLDGTASIRTLASSWAVTVPGWYYGELVSDSTAHIFGMTNTSNQASGVGYIPPPSTMSYLLPMFAADFLGGGTLGTSVVALADYVAGTYANFPESTSLTPTNTIFSSVSAGTLPMFGLYK